MNVSKLTLSCRWLSSASFSVVSSSIPSPCAFSPDTVFSRIQAGTIASSAAQTALRLGCRSASMVQEDAPAAPAAHSRSAMSLRTGTHSWAEQGEAVQGSRSVDRRVQPFKGTLREARGRGSWDCAAPVEESESHHDAAARVHRSQPTTESLSPDSDDRAVQCRSVSSKQEIHVVYARS